MITRRVKKTLKTDRLSRYCMRFASSAAPEVQQSVQAMKRALDEVAEGDPRGQAGAVHRRESFSGIGKGRLSQAVVALTDAALSI